MPLIHESSDGRPLIERRKRIETDLAPASTGFRSNAMIAGGLLFTGGHIGAPVSSPDNRIPPAAAFEQQIDLALQHMRTLILAGHGDLARVVEVSAFIVPFEREHIVRERIQNFLGYAPPLVHTEPVAAVALHAMLEVDGIAVVDSSMRLAEAAEILRPFGYGVGLIHSGPFIFLNGLTAPGATLGEQTRNLFHNADEQLRNMGTALSGMVKLTVYLSEYDTYPEFNDATKELFAEFDPPTRSVLIAPRITGDALLRVHLIALAS